MDDATLNRTATDVVSEILFHKNDSSNDLKPQKISKNQEKRLLKEAKRKETKAEWRKLQKAKRKMKEVLKKNEFSAKGIFPFF